LPRDARIMFIDQWHTPISNYLPGKDGRFEVDIMVVKRDSILKMGHVFGYEYCYFGQDAVLTRLIEHVSDGKIETWMSDAPAEVYAMAEIIARLQIEVPHRRKLLIGGLGLGLLSLMACNHFERVTVVELHDEVARLVRPYMPKNVKVVRGDFFDYLDKFGVQFDAVACDTFKNADHFLDSEQAKRWTQWTISHRGTPAYVWLAQQSFDLARVENRLQIRKEENDALAFAGSPFRLEDTAKELSTNLSTPSSAS
ncbi:MAG: hypothetical protein MN733_21655, partial [Nitrososphaera sp.]|nr:hypothetical protein [Nitrososphaera sp.]